MLDAKIITDDSTHIIIKEGGLVVGAIQMLEPNKTTLRAYRAVFDMQKISNHNVKRLSFDVVIKEKEKETVAGTYCLGEHQTPFLCDDFMIFNKTELKEK